jgi:hypothetical protein
LLEGGTVWIRTRGIINIFLIDLNLIPLNTSPENNQLILGILPVKGLSRGNTGI